MSRRVRSWRGAESHGLTFWCPGCEGWHQVGLEGPGPRWTWNGDEARPTLSPSVLIRTGHFVPNQPDGAECWCTFEARFKRKPITCCLICHSFVVDGSIQFLSDSTHKLAGVTVPLPSADRDQP